MYVNHHSVICNGGSAKDIACILKNLKDQGKDLNVMFTFIMNVPRSTENISYKAIESVKDGCITSAKYESCTLIFNRPHMWVFSNEKPVMNKISKDRWCIWSINDKMELVNQFNGSVTKKIIHKPLFKMSI